VPTRARRALHHDIEAEDIDIEGANPIDVGGPQVDMADGDARVDRARRGDGGRDRPLQLPVGGAGHGHLPDLARARSSPARSRVLVIRVSRLAIGRQHCPVPGTVGRAEFGQQPAKSSGSLVKASSSPRRGHSSGARSRPVRCHCRRIVEVDRLVVPWSEAPSMPSRGRAAASRPPRDRAASGS